MASLNESDDLKLQTLPAKTKAFCDSKKFSLKQCLKLCDYPQNLLNLFNDLLETLPISAGMYLDLIENAHDCLQNKTLTLTDLKKILFPQNQTPITNPNDSIQKIRSQIHALRFPIKTKINNRLNHALKDQKLPQNIKISWDENLENPTATIQITATDIKNFQDSLKALKSPKFTGFLKQFFSEEGAGTK